MPTKPKVKYKLAAMEKRRLRGFSPDLAGTKSLGVAPTLPELVSMVHAGLPFEMFSRLEKCTGWTSHRLAHVLDISAATLDRRRKAGRFSATESDRLLRLARVTELAVELFEDDQEAAWDWLNTEQPALGGAKPLDYATTEVGAREVERVIQRLEHGVAL